MKIVNKIYKNYSSMWFKQYEHRTTADTKNTTVRKNKTYVALNPWLHCLCDKLTTPTGHKNVDYK